MLKSTLAAQHGRRKSCVANAYISQGTGQLEVRRSFTARDALNARRAGKDRSSLKTRLSVNEYFETIATQKPQEYLEEIFQMIERPKHFNVVLHVKGGGLKAQLQACRLAIAKALVKLDAGYKTVLSAECRTDARQKERSKIGCRGKARRKVQFSKR